MTTCCEAIAEVKIIHVPTGKHVNFGNIKMQSFSDTLSPSWNEEQVYGRMDPIATFQGTTRSIELSFDLGPFTLSDARKQLALAKISRLMQFQYPTYSGTGAMAISRPPLLRVSFANYIPNLLCYMSAMAYTPVDGMDATTVPKIVGGQILPQRIAVSLSFKILHEKAPGWNDFGYWIGEDSDFEKSPISDWQPKTAAADGDSDPTTTSVSPDDGAPEAQVASENPFSDEQLDQIDKLTELGLM
jgi:hypothetical protein